MAEPENHTPHLLREIREAMRSTDKKIDKLDMKVDGISDEIRSSIDNLRDFMAGESVLGRYAAADVDKRIQALEKRITKLERAR